jgi:hypothetical protein
MSTQLSGSSELQPLFASIDTIAKFTGESPWTVKHKLRLGYYRARKSGRRTLVEMASVREHLATLPEAKFATPRNAKSKIPNPARLGRK